MQRGERVGGGEDGVTWWLLESSGEGTAELCPGDEKEAVLLHPRGARAGSAVAPAGRGQTRAPSSLGGPKCSLPIPPWGEARWPSPCSPAFLHLP